MNAHTAKAVRRLWRTMSAEQMGRCMEVYRVALNSEPLRRRIRLAWRLLRGCL